MELENYKGMPRVESPCRVDVAFTFKAKSAVSPKIGDLDNLLKAVWDGMVQTGLIADDRFVVATTATKKKGDYEQVRITVSLEDDE